MPFSNTSLPFDSADLVEMQEAFQGACTELGIPDDDKDRRDRLAALIIELAQNGERAAENLRARAVRLLHVAV